MEVDKNSDGAAEYRADAIAGVVYSEEWLDASGNIVKRIVYKNGWPSKGDIDSDGDGRLDLRREYDARGEITRIEPIPASAL